MRGPMRTVLGVVCVLGVLLAAGTAHAQSTGGGVGVGIKGGPIFSSFDAAQEDFGNNTGFEGGLFFGGNRRGVVGVQGEILYAKKGAEAVDLYYLEIPILLRINVGTSSLNGINVYGLGGPVADIQIKATDTNGDSVTDLFERADVGFLLGGGIEITRFLVEARYNWGLRNVTRDGLIDFGVEEIKNRSFAVLFGIRFN
jgi:hypothetical protein